ncbi:hypothetical protein DFH06DRAFT_1337628 [Mycena polygramma]|nr:hypothetical protein DFH06DRAFT_1337628 [Mycena polygramma]
MAFRKDRVRVVAVYNVPQASAQNFEPRFSEALEAFIRLPLVQKNILKFEISIANDGFDTTARSLGLQKPSFNSVVILEAETHEKINEIVSDPGFQKLFKAANDAGDFDMNTSIVFAADFMASIDK